MMNTTTQFWCDPAIPYAESRRACHSKACYQAHNHPTFSIGAIDVGSSIFTSACSNSIHLHQGTVVLIPALLVHACNPLPETTWSYQMLHLDTAWLHAVRQEYRASTYRFETESVQLISERKVYQHFCRLNQLLFSIADSHEKEASLIEFIGNCDARQALHLNVPTTAAHLAQRLAPVFDLLQRETAIGIALSDLAHLAGLSRYQLIRTFRSTTGLTPHAWQINQRIHRAREYIRAGKSLADIAYRLGFADQAHFQRAFKAHVGITPGRFRV